MAGRRTPARCKVAIVYPEVRRTGGIERYVREVSQRLARDNDVTVFSRSGDALDGCRGMRVGTLRRPVFLASFQFAFRATRSVGRGRFDLINAQGTSAFSQDVVTAHSCHRAWFTESLRRLRPLSLAWLLKLMNPVHYLTMLTESLQYRPGHYRRVIAVSESVRDDLLKHYGVPPDRVDVVYNGVEVRAFAPADDGSRDRTREELSIEEGRIMVLFVSNEYGRKGLETVIRALPRLTGGMNARLVVVGAGRPASYRRLARRLGVEEALTFVGPVEDPGPYYQAADVFALPTRYEAFGLVVLEAMAGGVPVIVSRCAGVSEVLQHGVSAYLLDDPTDHEELARAIGELADPARGSAVAREGLAVATRLSWERVAEGVADSYERALAEMHAVDQSGAA